MLLKIELTKLVEVSSISLLFLINIIASSLSGRISPLCNFAISSFSTAILCGSASLCLFKVKPNCADPNNKKLNIINSIVVLISRYLMNILRYN